MAVPSIYTGAMDAEFGIIDNATSECLCSAAPTTVAEATTTFNLATATMTGADFVMAADAAGTGRKMTVAAKPAVSVSTSGTATHVALTDGTNLLAVVALAASVVVTAASTVDLSSYEIRSPQPTAA